FSYLRPNRWLLPLFQRHQLHEDDRNHNHGESVNQKQPITLFAPSLSFDGKKHYFLLLLKNLHTGDRSTAGRHTSLDRDLSCSGQSLENLVNVLTLANLCPCIATKICKGDRKSTRLNSSHVSISYAVFCLKKKKKSIAITPNIL